jgi:crotonobetainyl-CoA:carnitine CoA-transferase CaiB-like acyl-CoA transferase
LPAGEDEPNARSSGPLAGVRILDLTRLLPGGYCTLLLSDLGTDVVKVEEPVRGDYIRWTPPMVDGESAAHRALNRGKRSITLNLKEPEGAALLRKLAGHADALIEGFRPGVLDRLGVGYEELSRANPALVFCAITGYGQNGPYRDLAGHDINYVGYGGVLSITGLEGGEPAVPGVQVGDLGGGMLAAIGILAALLECRATGMGRFVDASMLDAVVSWLSIHAGTAFALGRTPERREVPLAGGLACYRLYRTRDGRHLTVGALEPQFWQALCDALGCPELVADQYGPPERQREMIERIQAIFADEDQSDWLERLRGVPACVGPANDVLAAFEDPQVLHRRMLAEVEGVAVGPGPALKLSGLRPGPLRPAPSLGENTAEVLAEVGVGEEELAGLRARGVV